jgi:hypothetical protein
MIVLEEQTDLVVDLCQVVDHGRYDSLWIYPRAIMYGIKRRTSCSVVCASNSVTQVEEKFRGLVIVRINRVPRDEITISRKAIFTGDRQ